MWQFHTTESIGEYCGIHTMASTLFECDTSADDENETVRLLATVESIGGR